MPEIPTGWREDLPACREHQRQAVGIGNEAPASLFARASLLFTKYRFDSIPPRPMYQSTPSTFPLLRACWFREEGRHRQLYRSRQLPKER